MRSLTENVSYLQGLCEGLNVSDSGPNGKIISGILKVMEELADIVEVMHGEIHNLESYLEDIDDEIEELEKKVWRPVRDNVKTIDIRCSNCGEHIYFENYEDDDDVLEIICPNCDALVYVNDGSFDYESDNEEQEYSKKMDN
jgi:DNA-directed RNA polymerase subunit RPC12/RpoP